ncbi:hypothetical protein DID76_00510 [Candidatus Marinamargulisbacteria bacterium SCGC AG-414-C22]|nr:hypothetical protein DID76_00510 [Candidatus Marinamargulisbacteria bacterium SCGC AG-414-C22]
MKVSILIVNYNGEKFIDDCLKSVFASKLNGSIETIVVDNDSTDHSIAVLKSYVPKIKVIQNHHNSGFSKGNNIAADYASGDYLFLLNNDTILKEDTIQVLLDFMTSKPNIGVVVPKLLNEDGSLQCPGSILGQWRFKSNKPTVVPFVAGAAVLMKRTVFDEINGLDENLFFYNDDIDLCKSLKRAGYDIYYEPRAQLIHIGGLSTKFRKLKSLVEGYRGGFYICQKFYGPVALTGYRILIFFDLIPRLCMHLFKSLFSEEDAKYVKSYLKIIKINLNKEFDVNHPKVKVTEIK